MNDANSPYQDLANAIILQAVKDYREAQNRHRKHPEKDTYRCDKESIERFFYSTWFNILTNLDPMVLITKLRKEMA
jgi:hypothetical protein